MSTLGDVNEMSAREKSLWWRNTAQENMANNEEYQQIIAQREQGGGRDLDAADQMLRDEQRRLRQHLATQEAMASQRSRADEEAADRAIAQQAQQSNNPELRRRGERMMEQIDARAASQADQTWRGGRWHNPDNVGGVSGTAAGVQTQLNDSKLDYSRRQVNSALGNTAPPDQSPAPTQGGGLLSGRAGQSLAGGQQQPMGMPQQPKRFQEQPRSMPQQSLGITSRQSPAYQPGSGAPGQPLPQPGQGRTGSGPGLLNSVMQNSNNGFYQRMQETNRQRANEGRYQFDPTKWRGGYNGMG